MLGLDDGVLMDILSRAVGPERARAAFPAFSLPPSVSIRLNPFKCSASERILSTPLHPLGGLRGGPLRLPESPSSELLQPSVPGRVHPRFAAAEYGLSPASARNCTAPDNDQSHAVVPEKSDSLVLKAVTNEDNATLGTRGGTGAERSGASGGAERSEASEWSLPSGKDQPWSDYREVPWNRYGVVLGERPRFVMDPLFHAGCYYVQDSSAMVVGHMVREHLDLFEGLGRPVRVLDLCAAPGGKTTDLAASLRERFGDGFQLVANEVMRQRASVLCDNVAVWGEPNVIVTSCDPKAFARLEGYFDIIVTDVPCSGEGMFRKDPKAVEDWSPEAVNLCAARQKRILADVWPALRTGGLLVYSTCTFEEAENDSNVEWTVSELGAEVKEYDYSGLPGVIPTRTGGLLVPGFVEGEGQFVSVIGKTSPSGSTRQDPGILHPLRSGLDKGVMKGKDLVPSADWVLSIFPPLDLYPAVELDRETSLRYLHRDGIFIEGQPEGFLIVCHEGHPLGFVKNIGRRWNNLHPQNRRIRIDL